jgi:hypothetical protein
MLLSMLGAANTSTNHTTQHDRSIIAMMDQEKTLTAACL